MNAPFKVTTYNQREYRIIIILYSRLNHPFNNVNAYLIIVNNIMIIYVVIILLYIDCKQGLMG